MKEKPLISVIVPMYNCGEYISKCLDSLLAQTYDKIEIIVIDDGSEDGGGEICRKFAQKDERIKYIAQNNQGVSQARNNGLNHANGEWLTFCDSDDRVESDLIKYLLELAQRYNADISRCGVIMELGSESIRLPCPKEETVIEKFFQADKRLLRYYGKTVYPKLFKRELLNDLRFDPMYTIGEDTLFAVRAAIKSEKIVLGSEYKYRYLQRGDSACNKAPTEASLVSARNAIKEILSLLPAESGAKEFYFEEQLRNDFDICSKYVRFCPSDCQSAVGEVKNELRENLTYILKNADFSAKEKIKALLIIKAWRLYSQLIGRKKRKGP